MTRWATTFLAAAAFAGLAAGCGYRAANDYDGKPQGKYEWHSLYREDIRTVAVPIFTNKSFTKGIEFQLTKAVVSDIEAFSPYKVVDRASADTILEGEITNVTGTMISSDRNTALPQEEMITITVNFIWKDLRTGRIIRQKKDFQQCTMYYPTMGESAYVGKQSGVEKLALGVVQQMQSDW